MTLYNMERFNFEKSRIIIEILSYSMVIIFDAVLVFRLVSSGYEAIEFYLDYLRIPMNPDIIYLFMLLFSLAVLYVSLKAVVIFLVTLRTDISYESGCLFIRYKDVIHEITVKKLDYKIIVHPIPKLTFGKRLKTIRICAERKRYSFAYEYLYDADSFLEVLGKG